MCDDLMPYAQPFVGKIVFSLMESDSLSVCSIEKVCKEDSWAEVAHVK